MADNISYIHANKLARYNFHYYGSDGTIYIGQKDGRLKKKETGVTNTTVNSTGVQSITGLNTNNTDPSNPIIQISVDGTTITGDGTPSNPLVSHGGTVMSVTDDSSGVVTVDNTDPANPIILFKGVFTDGTTITGDGTSGNPLVATSGGGGAVDVISPFLLMGG